MSSATETSPWRYARLGGALYLIIILCGAFAEGFVMDKLVVSGDAVATAHNILAAPSLWRLGVASNVLLVMCAVPLLWIEYQLLKPVSKSLAQLSLLFNGVSLAVEAVSKVFLLLVMPILASTATLPDGSGLGELPLLATLALKSHNIAFNVALLFFGCTCLVNGYLIFRSGYFPRFLGVLLQIAGGGYLVACTAALFAPALAAVLLPAILLLPLVGELALCLWLLLKGVNRPQWQVRVSASA
ncbi:DUF4386 domain-containing protein [Hymenobacter sp. BT190]|uniref:DUF4386 domain-containing protein n=1 Tax=Hymenobacter sp. BT190 TaxID=2763505 RepID=UPI001650DCA8|nr:DUF4386 domain-containing protein [Hymenobacter sp. BT190]MBC6699355.1 DUF4386 domain-containing protein [Hymenobacter sp. BT190]